MLLHDLILRQSSARPDNIAVTQKNRTLTYRELAILLHRAARGFRTAGLSGGKRIAVYLNKRVEAVVSYFGAGLADCVFVPINMTLKPQQVAHILADCDVSLLVTGRAQAETLSEHLADLPSLRTIVSVDSIESLSPHGPELIDWSSFLGSSPDSAMRSSRIDTDIASILYTSGSTGKPKGVVLSHRNMVAGALSVAEYLQNDEQDVLVAALPFSFDAGFSQMTTAFSVGASVVLLDYLLPRDVINAVARHSATGLAGVPPLWIQLAGLDWPLEATSSLRYITNTGGAMPVATLNTLREKLPSTTPYLMYGLTEAFRSTYLDPKELDCRPTSMGKAIPNAEILVVREDGSVCDANEPGELVHRGPLVSLGYWNDPDRTAERFRRAPNQPAELPFDEMAVWSGDTVIRDEDGFLYFVGRKDDMIKSSGYRISPTEVEEVIYGTGLVNECAALGLPHTMLGQAVVIICYCEEPTESLQDELVKACKAKLPNYMIPERIEFDEPLPRNPNGKIDRKKLKAKYEGLFKEVVT